MIQNWKGGVWQTVKFKVTSVEGFSQWSNLVHAKKDDDLVECRPRVKFPLTLLALFMPREFFRTEPNWVHFGCLGWLYKKLFWRKCAILYVTAKPGTKYRIGFYSKNMVHKVSSIVHTAVDHPEKHGRFAMRIGPNDVHFFVVSDHKAILCHPGYAYTGSKVDRGSCSDVVVY